MSEKSKQETKQEGPPAWQILLGILTAAMISYALAGFGVGKFYDLMTESWEFWAALYGAGLTGSMWHKKNKMQYNQSDQEIQDGG